MAQELDNIVPELTTDIAIRECVSHFLVKVQKLGHSDSVSGLHFYSQLMVLSWKVAGSASGRQGLFPSDR